MTNEMFTDIPDSRPQKGCWAPGKYWCQCGQCGRQFTGDKRAVECAACAYEDLVVKMPGVAVKTRNKS